MKWLTPFPLWITFCLAIPGLTGVHGCNDYLVSGVNVVPDEKLKASSSVAGWEPQKARLHLDGTGNGWCAQDNNPNSTEHRYIQVEFNEKSHVKALLTQGAGNSKGWLTSFEVAHSSDEASWQTIQLFTGNTDRNTIKTNTFLQSVQTKFLRITVRKWKIWPCLRFDVIGCSTAALPTRTHYYGEYVPLRVDDSMTSSRVWTRNDVADLPGCVAHCDDDTGCLSFSFNQSASTCNGYDVQFYRNDLLFDNGEMEPVESLGNLLYYFDRSMVDVYGYTVDIKDGVCYKIYTERKTHTQASTTCTSQTTRVFPISASSQLDAIQEIITKSTVLSYEGGLHVDGSYKGGKWIHYNNIEINFNLWALGKNDSFLGTCVIMTSQGLSAAQCDQQLFYICGL